MKTQVAVYVGSLDPITNGHINIIERAARLFDKLFVIVASDNRKTYMFSVDERIEMVKGATAHISNVHVRSCSGRYVVRATEEYGANVLIRGIRNMKDLEDELVLATENRMIAPNIETVWMPCLQDLVTVSSSMVKSHIGADPSWEVEVSRSVTEFVLLKLREKYMYTSAERHWKRLTEIIGVHDCTDQVFGDLVAHYEEAHRYYHTLLHILKMLDECERVGSQDPALLCAVWFHDAIYDTHSSENEVNSAKFASEALRRLGQKSNFIREVQKLILSTTHCAASTDSSARLMLDLDLTILGSPEKEYRAYEQAIRQEYAWVPLGLFREERTKILRTFLKRKTIYSTMYFYERYEYQAQANIKNAIAALQT